jgi:hypothetical protein
VSFAERSARDRIVDKPTWDARGINGGIYKIIGGLGTLCAKDESLPNRQVLRGPVNENGVERSYAGHYGGRDLNGDYPHPLRRNQ